jgi:hypothetical protein
MPPAGIISHLDLPWLRQKNRYNYGCVVHQINTFEEGVGKVSSAFSKKHYSSTIARKQRV